MAQIKNSSDFDYYFFNRLNKNNIPGYDQIVIVALNQLQAARHLTEITPQANEFYFSHSVVFVEVENG